MKPSKEGDPRRLISPLRSPGKEQNPPGSQTAGQTPGELARQRALNGDTDAAEEFAKKHIFSKPKYFLDLNKVRKLFGVDRRITVKEFLQVAFGDRETFEMKDDLLELEWEKFVDIYQVDQAHYQPAKNFFKAYIVDAEVRDIIKTRQLARFHQCASFDFDDYEKLNGYKTAIPEYIQDYAYNLTNL